MAEIFDVEFELYIDRQLPEERKQVVEDCLRRDLIASQGVGAHARQADALRAEFRPVADLCLPGSLDRVALECRFVIPAPAGSWLLVGLMVSAAFAAGVVVGLFWSTRL